MLGQYMHSIGYGAYESDSGIGFAFNGYDGFGALPAPVLNFLFAPEEITEGEFKGAMLSRGFRIQKEGENYFIVPKGASEIAAIAGQATGSSLIGLAVGAIGDVAGQLTNVRAMIPDITKPFKQQTSVGGELVYEPAGMNMLLIAGAVAAVLVLGIVLLKR